MTLEELKEAIESFKKEGYTEEEILKIFYVMYQDDAISLDTLRTLTEAMGYEFTEEFEAMSDEDKKTKGLTKEDEVAEDVDKEEVEDAKEYQEGEDEAKETEKVEEKDEEEDDDKKAARLFGFDKK